MSNHLSLLTFIFLLIVYIIFFFFFFFQAEDGIRDKLVTGVQTCALPIFLPSHCDHALPLEILVDLEEVLDLPERMLRQIGDVEELVLKGIVRRPRDDLSVRVAAVEHLEQADRAHVDLAPHEGRLPDQHEHVARIAVFGQRARDEPVVPRIVDRGVQHAVQPEQPRLLVKLVLVATAARDLDDRGDLVGRVFPRWEIVPGVDHLVTLVSTPGTVKPHPSTMIRYFEAAQNLAESAIRTLPVIVPSSDSGVSSAVTSCRDTIRYSLLSAGSGSSLKWRRSATVNSLGSRFRAGTRDLPDFHRTNRKRDPPISRTIPFCSSSSLVPIT